MSLKYYKRGNVMENKKCLISTPYMKKFRLILILKNPQ